MRRILWAAAGAFLLKVLLALFTAGTNDALTWEHNLARLDNAGFAELYRAGAQYNSPSGKAYPAQAFIHPPAVLHLLRALGKMQQLSGLPVRFWLRTTCALADAVMLGLLLRARRASNRAFVLLALSPASILISGFHGNTDPILVLFALAAVLLAERGRPLSAGIAFGIACGIKLIPLLFAPSIFFHLRSPRRRSAWIVASGATWFALSLPYIALEPALILKTMLSYTSATGVWGFSLLSTLLGSGSLFHSLYEPAARWIALLAAVAAPLLLRRRPSLFHECGLVTFAFLFLSPGFGLQYLCWTIPWTLRLDFRWMATYHAVAGAFLLLVYTSASRSTRGYADLLTRENLTLLILIGLICWIETGVLAWRWIRPGLCTAGAAQAAETPA
ncbi:MAG TPA: glycosyltransferase 87 family protein [Bryobacteraceae bacterium]|nr:glycosyltransferase 87 family protein [Bryobacteraceae bacterium]